MKVNLRRLLFPFGVPDIKFEVIEPTDVELVAKAKEIAEKINALAQNNYIVIDGQLVELDPDMHGVHARVYTSIESETEDGHPTRASKSVRLRVYHKRNWMEIHMDGMGMMMGHDSRLIDVRRIMGMVVEAPPAWAPAFAEADECLNDIRSSSAALSHIKGALYRGHRINLMLFHGNLLPVVKFYENQGWITHGWQGPAITIVNLSERTIGGMIPDTVDLFNYHDHVLPKHRKIFDSEFFQLLPDVFSVKADVINAIEQLESDVHEIEFGERNPDLDDE